MEQSPELFFPQKDSHSTKTLTDSTSIVKSQSEASRYPLNDEFLDEITNHALIQEAIEQRNQLMEGGGLFSLSKSNFDTYFASDYNGSPKLKQQNLGDCYTIAAIYALSRSPHFEMIIRSSLQRFSDGSWTVRLPLFDSDGKTMTLTQDEYLPETNRQFLKLKRYEGKKDGKIKGVDFRKQLKLVKGTEGFQVLEAAFIKNEYGSVDRLAASEGGFSSVVFNRLCGNNFIDYTLDGTTWNDKLKKWHYKNLSSIDSGDIAKLDDFLENYDPEVYIATASCLYDDPKNILGNRVKGGLHYIYSNHAYAISHVDSKKKQISIVNPWNTSKSIKLSFEQFKKIFGRLNAVRINSAKLLQNIDDFRHQN